MVVVTDKKYFLDDNLKEKLDLMIDRMTNGNKDNLLLIDGNEGDGKTNMELSIAYYVAHTTKREFNIDHIFFDLEKLMEYGMKTKEQVICWDEGALGGLAQEWWNKNQKKFLKFLMVARKKRHFFIICIPKFFKLNEYLVVDRSIGLVHVYLGNGIQHGRFVYYNERQKEKLYQDWRKRHIRNYRMLYSFRGRFVMMMNKGIIDEDEYERRKDDAILNIDKEDKVDIRAYRNQIWTNAIREAFKRNLKIRQEDWCAMFGISTHPIQDIYKKLRDEEGFTTPSGGNYNTIVNNNKVLSPASKEDNTLNKSNLNEHWKDTLKKDMDVLEKLKNG